MALETSTFAVGNAVYPLPAATTNSLLQDADPALYWISQFIASVITTNIGTRLLAEVSASGGTRIASAVAYTIPDDPTDYLTAEHIKFPLLAVYRTNETAEDRTVTWRHTTAEWKCVYVLPPMSAGQRERLNPILKAVYSVVMNRTEMGHDAGFQSDAAIFGASYANVESIYVTGVTYASWSDGGEMTFPAAMITLQVKERVMPVTGAFDAMAGIDTNLDVAQTGETTLADVVVLDTDTSP